MNLSSNSLGDEGTESIAMALKESTTSKLQKLDMCNNGIGPKGAAALASYMAVSASLTEVSAPAPPPRCACMPAIVYACLRRVG